MRLLQGMDVGGAEKPGDAAYELVAQLLTAQLNLGVGAEFCPAVEDAVKTGQLLLISLEFEAAGDYLGPESTSDEVGRFLGLISPNRLFITDFSFHSIGVVLARLRQIDALLRFVQDVFVDGGASLIHLGPHDMSDLVDVLLKTDLDFDDAYQYVTAERYDLTIVGFDADFDRTERGRRTPAEVLAG